MTDKIEVGQVLINKETGDSDFVASSNSDRLFLLPGYIDEDVDGWFNGDDILSSHTIYRNADGTLATDSEQPDDWWRVEVSDNKGLIVAIEPEHLAGRDIADHEGEIIEKAIKHLAGFYGTTAVPEIQGGVPPTQHFHWPDGSFPRELQTLINCHSIEGGSDTPDFILTEFLRQCLDAFDMCVRRRNDWYKPVAQPPAKAELQALRDKLAKLCGEHGTLKVRYDDLRDEVERRGECMERLYKWITGYFKPTTELDAFCDWFDSNDKVKPLAGIVPLAEKEAGCEWDDYQMDEPTIGNGHLFFVGCQKIDVDVPDDHPFKFCPYCGKPIKEVGNE